MSDATRISQIIEAKRDLFIQVSDGIWDHAELKFEEYRSSALLCRVLEENGFTVERNVDGMETAFIASHGEGKPVIAILAEYDALDGLSQVGCAARKEALVEGGPGHGCGHQLLGAGAVAAAIALRQYREECGLGGTIRLYGCPGEEGGFSKTYLVRDGFFQDVDCALTWHPAPVNMVVHGSSLANINMYFRFKGVSSHAAFAPELGRSALDALELMNVGVNFLREHVPQDARMHYAIINAGGRSPNVVQAETEEYFCMRSPKSEHLRAIRDRVCDIAKGAALMTGTTLEYEMDSAVSEAQPNLTLDRLFHGNFSRLGTPVYDDADRKVIDAFRSIQNETVRRSVPAPFADKPIIDVLLPFDEKETTQMGSTDVADVSWVVPTAQCWVTCAANGSQLHSWEMVAQGKTSIAHKGMLHAAKIIAVTAADILHDPGIADKAKSELAERLGEKSYVCPIPAGVKPSRTGRSGGADARGEKE